LVTRSDPVLFELIVLFGGIRALVELGWSIKPLRLFNGKLSLRARQGEKQLLLHYQHVPKDLRHDGKYQAVLRAHGLTVASPRPDLVIELSDEAGRPPRWILIEVKLSDRPGDHTAREALQNLLSYRRAFS